MARTTDQEWDFDDKNALLALTGAFGVAAPAARLAIYGALGPTHPEVAGRAAQALLRVEAFLEEGPWERLDPVVAAIRTLAPVSRELVEGGHDSRHIAVATAREAMLMIVVVVSDCLAQLARDPNDGPPTALTFAGVRFTDQNGGTMRAVPSIAATLAVERGTTAMWCAELDPSEYQARWGRLLGGIDPIPDLRPD